jgi:hypothetical protein
MSLLIADCLIVVATMMIEIAYYHGKADDYKDHLYLCRSKKFLNKHQNYFCFEVVETYLFSKNKKIWEIVFGERNTVL